MGGSSWGDTIFLHRVMPTLVMALTKLLSVEAKSLWPQFNPYLPGIKPH